MGIRRRLWTLLSPSSAPSLLRLLTVPSPSSALSLLRLLTVPSTSSAPFLLRLCPFSSATSSLVKNDDESVEKIRNIGILAPFDSGRIALAEEILFHGDKGHEMPVVRDDYIFPNGDMGRTIQPDATSLVKNDDESVEKIRNIGILAPIDSGRIALIKKKLLFHWDKGYEKPIVRKKYHNYLLPGEGYIFPNGDMERSIRPDATFCTWKGCQVNIIDTPDRDGFTTQAKRALLVLDGAILVLRSLGGALRQSTDVDWQMRGYEVPKIAFINKLDRIGADPWKVLSQAREKLRHNSAAVQVPIGLEEEFEGLIDLVQLKAYYFRCQRGVKLDFEEVPNNMEAIVAAKRRELIEGVSKVDDRLAKLFLASEPISPTELQEAIRRATIARKFIPIFMGSTYEGTGVQPLIDGVVHYLPSPTEISCYALDQTNKGEKVMLSATPVGPLVALAFKLQERYFCEWTFLRIYRGLIRKGDFIFNVNTGKKVKVARLFRMHGVHHTDQIEDIQEAHAGQIIVVPDIDCASGDTFTDATVKYTMASMNVPEPVLSLVVSPLSKASNTQFSKALNRFQREDPSFRVSLDSESGQTIMSGMDESQLDIYVNRIQSECKVTVGKLHVNFKETITQRAQFDYLHKKQCGGHCQYGRVCGYIEPLPHWSSTKFEFENMIVGQSFVPSNFISAIEKGFKEAVNSGSSIGCPVENIRVVLTDGAAHAVDSSEFAFKLASIYAFRQCYSAARPVILEPIMLVSLKGSIEFQGAVIGDINKRRGVIVGIDQDEDDFVITANVPLNNMLGYHRTLRSMTQGKAGFTMEYIKHSTVPQDVQMELVNNYKATKGVV